MPYRVPRRVAWLNLLFDRCYPVYRSVYFLYKRLSDRRVCSFLKKRLREIGDRPATVLDIGANVGFYTRFLAENSGPAVSILAFEPAPANLRRLGPETSGLANVKILPWAVAAAPGQVELTLSPDSAIDHHLAGPAGAGAQTVLVKAVALDEMDWPLVDLIKMDIQGAEYLALRGMTKLLARSPGCVIVMELWPWGLRRAGSDWRELLALLKENDLTVQSFDGRDVEAWCQAKADRSEAHLDVILRRGRPAEEPK